MNPDQYSSRATFAVRHDDGSIGLSFSCESLLTTLFGSRYYRYHSHTLANGRWRRLLRRVTEKLELAIALNVETDYAHRHRLLSHLAHIRKALMDRKNHDPEVIASMFMLSFELLGGMPDVSRKRNGICNKDYDTRTSRSIQYIQSSNQKANAILEAYFIIGFDKKMKYDDLCNIYFNKFSCRSREFVHWFKTKYSSFYAKLF